MRKLDGLVTIITGAANGLGEATARRFAADGAIVLLSDIQAERGADVAGDIGAAFLKADVTDESEIEALVDEAVRRHGRLDCMINNAGLLGVVGSIAELPASGWRQTIDILLGGVFYGMKHAARQMISQRNGIILNTASLAGLIARGPHAYIAAKHGVVGLTKSVASELSAYGIRVNAVAPGLVPSALTGDIFGSRDKVRETAAAHNPLGQVIEPEEIAGAFAYLASPDARSITGQVITVDAGVTACPTAIRS